MTMNKMWTGLITLLRADHGLTTVEYAIAGGLVGLAVVLAFTNLGTAVGNVINAIIAILPG